MKLKYIPNILSVIRLALVGVFIAVFFGLDYEFKNQIALSIFVLAGLTDVVDGFLARRFGWITDAGKILDPLVHHPAHGSMGEIGASSVGSENDRSRSRYRPLGGWGALAAVLQRGTVLPLSRAEV